MPIRKEKLRFIHNVPEKILDALLKCFSLRYSITVKIAAVVSSQVGLIWFSGSIKPYVPLSLNSNVYEKGIPRSAAQSLEEPELKSVE